MLSIFSFQCAYEKPSMGMIIYGREYARLEFNDVMYVS